ncbi:MAG: TolC family protein [Planctomycetes bacterium]|nr:TolC family protein [Planctomycetota bacterium]
MRARRWAWSMLLFVLAGCRQVCIYDIDATLCGRADRPVDLGPEARAELGGPVQSKDAARADLLPVSAQDKDKQPKSLLERLEYPEALPGGKVPPIKLPPPGSPKKEIDAAYQKYFPSLPELAPLPAGAPGPFGHPLTLAELQKLALTNSPVLKQAIADVEAARGAMIQAGLHPNPTVGYEGDNMNQGHTSGTQGGFVDQVVKTANKLGLARAAGERDVRIAELKLRAAESDVQTQVRSNYFGILSARKNLEVNRGLAHVTDEIYKVLVLQLQAGEVATYEPMQVRVLALQARGFSIQAHNRYLSAWKQLAAATGLPGMPLTDVAGRIDASIPHFEYDSFLAKVLSGHTDVASAQTAIDKSRLLLRLAQVQPIPDVDVRVAIQHDTTNTPHAVQAGVQIGVALPVWDRNQGNIQQALANLRRAMDESHRVRATLTSKAADAFERYDNNRKLLELYRTQMLPSQVQAFRGAVARHARAGEKGGVSYNDLVTAEQTLVTLLTSYLGTLKDQWDAVVDIANLLQTNDIFQTGEGEPVAPVPNLHELCPVGADSPCSPLQGPELRRADGRWN